jgi:hypothetical protein
MAEALPQGHARRALAPIPDDLQMKSLPKLPWTNAHFDSRLVVESVTPNAWNVFRPLTWHGNITETVPAGFETDFASIPAFAAVFGFDDDDWCEAAALHDWIYRRRQEYGKKVADDEFWLALRVTGCPPLKSWIIHRMVSWFGGSAWRNSTAILAGKH